LSGKIVLSAFLFSALVGLTSLVGPQYIAAITQFKTGSLTLIKDSVIEHCDEETKICSKAANYLVQNGPLVSSVNTVLVVGRIWNASEIFCDKNKIFTTGDPKNPIGSRDTNNQFVLVPSDRFTGCRNELTVLAYFNQGQKKNGLLDGNPYFADKAHGQALQRFNEFLSQDFKIFNLCALLGVLFFTILIRIVTIDDRSKDRVYLAGVLGVGALAQSGFLEVWLPMSIMPVVGRWLSTLSYCLYLSLSINYFSKNRRLGKLFTRIGLVAFPLILIYTQNRVVTWIDFSFFAAGLGLLAALLDRSLSLFCLSILTLMCSFEFVGYSWAPNGYTAPTFLASVIVLENFRAFVSYLKINRLLKLSRSREKFNAKRKNHFRAPAIIKLFQNQFRIGRITVLNLSDPEIIQIQKYINLSTQPINSLISELPPMFAHVVTTGNALINVHSDSSIAFSLRRGNEKVKAKSDYFTVLPIFAGKDTIGAIALTEYDSEQFRTSLNYSTFLFCLDLLKGILVDHLLTTPKTDALNKIKTLNQSISDTQFSETQSIEHLIRNFGHVLNASFGWRVIAATLPTPDNLLKVVEIFSFDPQIEQRIRNGKLYAHEDNKQGPLALAVHERKPVIVPNTKWLEGVVHANTTEFFKIHGTRTAAFVPVLGNDGTPVGVFWIEGTHENEISYSDRELFNAFMTQMTERLKLMISNSKLSISNQSLSQFLPKHLVEDFLAGKDVREVDHGFLMMFDLKGSTRLAHALGNDVFHEQVDAFKEVIEKSLLPHQWILQQYVWDGFEFTLSSDEADPKRISIDEWAQMLAPIFDEWKQSLIAKFGELPEVLGLSYRLCFTYGDTSRGIVVEGATQKWTFVGNAIAVVSKVEQAAKTLPGKVFCDQSMLKHCVDEWTEIHRTNQGLIIYSLDEQITQKSAA
jgi:class 3 adenylate cyclase